MAKNLKELPDLAVLLPSWELALQASGKAGDTIATYLGAVQAFLRWAEAAEQPAALTAPVFRAFIVDQQATKAQATVTSRHICLRLYSAWLLSEGEVTEDHLAGLKAPTVDEVVIRPLSEEEAAMYIKACHGSGWIDLRDEAIFRLMFVTAARASEIANLRLTDIDVAKGTAVIRRGKGGDGRLVAFDPRTAYALDRYIRARRKHALAGSDALWLSGKGRTFGYSGIYSSMCRRAEKAGIEGFHPHRCRHGGADAWLARGGSEGGLMAMGGWKSRQMMDRYTKHRSSVRAIAEAHRLDLGNF